MKPLFEISAQGWKSIDELVFYTDRLEHTWKTPPSGSGTSVYPRSALSPHLSSQRTFGWGAAAAFRSFASYFGIALILHAGFGTPALQVFGIGFYILSVACLIYGLTKLKHDEWLYITRTDGATVITLRARGIGGYTPEEFRQKYESYVREAEPAHATI